MPRDSRSGSTNVNSNAEVWKPRVTVAAICEKDKKFLLVAERIDGKVVLNQPAGHLDAGESLEQAVVRETLEETAFDFTPSRLVGVYRYTPQPDSAECFLRFAFSGSVGECHQRPLDDEIISTEWMSVDEIRQSHHMHRSPMVLQCVLDYLQKPSYPLQVFSSDFL